MFSEKTKERSRESLRSSQSDLKMEALQPNLHFETVHLCQASTVIQPSNQKETATEDPGAQSKSSRCEKAIAAIQKEYNLYKRHIDRYCQTLHKHGWDLQKALEELLKCSQKWMKRDDFTSGRINEILERIKHDLELLYVPKLVPTDIKLENAQQPTTKEPLFTSQTTMNNLNGKRTCMRTIGELYIELTKKKRKHRDNRGEEGQSGEI